MVLTRPQRLAVALILLLGAIARAHAFTPFGVHHPDEAFQYLEQAHRLVFGTGIVPWEYRYGMRSWLVPGTLAGPMWLGDAVAPGSMLYAVFPRVVTAILASSTLWSAWTIGARISRWHGLAALAITALWFESVFFSVHVLTETLAAAAILAACASAGGRPGLVRPMAFGALLMLGAVLRFHYLPAIGVLAVATLRDDWRGWALAAAGGTIVAAVSAGVDLCMGQVPFGWVIENFRQNVILGRSADFGTEGPLAYVLMWLIEWRGAFPLVLILAWLGAKRLPVPMVVALVNLVVHSLIGHKEYRFVWLSTQLLLVLAGVGSVDAVRLIATRFGWDRARIGAAVGAAWATASLLLAIQPAMLALYGEGAFRLTRRLDQAGACGIAVAGTKEHWLGGGYLFAHLSRPAQYFVSDSLGPAVAGQRVSALAGAADGILTRDGAFALPPGYRQLACHSEGGQRFCAYRRPGGCRISAQSDKYLLQNLMIQYDR